MLRRMLVVVLLLSALGTAYSQESEPLLTASLHAELPVALAESRVVAVSSQGLFAAVAVDEGTSVALLDVNIGRVSPALSLDADVIGALAFDPGGERLAVATDSALWLLDVFALALDDPAVIARLPLDDAAPAQAVAFTRDGGTVLLLRGDSADGLLAWDLSGDSPVPTAIRVEDEAPAWLASLSLTRTDAGVLLLGKADADAEAWTVAALSVDETGLSLGFYAGLGAQRGDPLGLSRDAARALFFQRGGDSVARVIDLESAEESAAVLTPNDHGLALSPNGRLLATTDGARLLHFWDLADPAEPTLSQTVTLGEPPYALAFSADGATLLLAGESAVLSWTLGGAIIASADSGTCAVTLDLGGTGVGLPGMDDPFGAAPTLEPCD